MNKCQDNGEPVGSILLRTGLEADVREFSESGGVRGALYWRETAEGGEVGERRGRGADMEVSGVGYGAVIPKVTTSCIAPAVVEPGEVIGILKLSTA